MVDPISTAITGMSLANTAAELYKKANEIYQSTKDRETKAKIEALLDSIHDLKAAAINLEDENRELNEKLRFKSDEYTSPDGAFFYHKSHPERPLCPACHADGIDAMMSPPTGPHDAYRVCFRCSKAVDIPGRLAPRFDPGGPYDSPDGGENGWMR